MSGTSLDGLDIALCEFEFCDSSWNYKIIKTTTSEYSLEEKKKLSLMAASALQLAESHAWFGKYCGQKVAQFLKENRLEADLIASHGHTVFHQPVKGFTTQIGCGATLSAETNLPVVSDFRSLDVALGGQGAPLVPIGDLLLFKEFDSCLNLGGIANLSVKTGGSIKAYDVCPANMALNYLAQKKGMEFDNDGNIASIGKVDTMLLTQLEKLDFYMLPSPKSLGKEWVDTTFLPLLQSNSLSVEDKMATVVEHIALQLAKELMSFSHSKSQKLLLTGGGAFNTFLLKRLGEKLDSHWILTVPDPLLISFKEALIFAFLGVLRINNVPNSITSVTGARKDNIGGALYGNFSSFV